MHEHDEPEETPRFHIWTNEKGKGWWKPDANGYTQKRADAGRFSMAEALEHCRGDWQWQQGKDAPRVLMVPAE